MDRLRIPPKGRDFRRPNLAEETPLIKIKDCLKSLISLIRGISASGAPGGPRKRPGPVRKDVQRESPGLTAVKRLERADSLGTPPDIRSRCNPDTECQSCW